MAEINGPAVQLSMESITRDLSFQLDTSTGFELSDVRAKCHNLHMEPCYKRYRERLLLTNLALYLLIMELLLIVHVLYLSFKPNTSFLNALPFIIVMVFLPLILYVCFKDKSKFDKFPMWNNLASVGAIMLVTFVDTFPHFITSRERLLDSYDHISITSVYLFLPIAFYGRPYILGAVISIWYFCFEFLTEPDEKNQSVIIFGEYGIYLLSLNLLMLALCYNIEFRLRQKILKRRQLLHQNLLLQIAMKKESEMIHTILLPQIADSLQQEIRSRIEDARLGKNYFAPRTLFVEIHSDVSILVADMVHFTYLTTKLECKQLVTILHELFVAFDLAAEQNKVLRIKFSGDCYNCVAGIPNFYSQHAKYCIKLAMEMISKIHHLRRLWGLDIDMRIGVHSGEVFSGIIGSTKWQYDIWSKDVDIAYRLEHTGMAGMVHISKATLSLLNNEYSSKESSNLTKNDPFLQRLQLKTYLIDSVAVRHETPISFSYTSSISNLSSLSNISNASNMTLPNNEFEEIWQKTRLGMIEKAEQMPVGCIQLARIFYFAKRDIPGNEDSLFRPHISSIWRLFRTGDYEWTYMNEPDVLMKYSLLMVFFVGVVILVCDRISEFSSKGVTIYILLAFLFIICLAACFKHIWLQMNYLFTWSRPTFILSRWLYEISQIFENQLLARILVSFSSIFVVYVMATLNTVDCDPNKMNLALIEADLSSSSAPRMCFDPWEVTEYVVMVLALLFFFAGLSLVFKAGLAIFITASYILIVKTFDFAWKRTAATNTELPPEHSGIWYVVEFFVLLLISEQHLAYIDKADYHSKICYEEKLRRTEISTQSVEIILTNILPRHVADCFLERGKSDELFYEDYSKVAVMFAAIENYEPDRMGLRVLNEFICCFDDILASYKGQFKVEKIKVIGWTYMAACGLEAENMKDYSAELSLRERSQKKIPLRRSSNLVRFFSTTMGAHAKRITFKPRFSHTNLQKDDNCVLTMLQFAAEMLRTMAEISQQNVYLDFGGFMQGNLKIGISHGPVMAGVVGFSRPQYDIWGHTVNMASRMATTGDVGSIQVTENTALVLRDFDVKCNYRGLTEIKGVGAIPTYFVALNDSFHLQHIDDIDLDTIKIVGEESIQKQDNVVILDIIASENDSIEDLEENDTQAKSTVDLHEKGTQTFKKKHFEKKEDSNQKGSKTKSKNDKNEEN